MARNTKKIIMKKYAQTHVHKLILCVFFLWMCMFTPRAQTIGSAKASLKGCQDTCLSGTQFNNWCWTCQLELILLTSFDNQIEYYEWWGRPFKKLPLRMTSNERKFPPNHSENIKTNSLCGIMHIRPSYLPWKLLSKLLFWKKYGSRIPYLFDFFQTLLSHFFMTESVTEILILWFVLCRAYCVLCIL